MNKNYSSIILLCGLACLLLTTCSTRNEKDPDSLAKALADSLVLVGKNFGVSIDISYSSPASLNIRGELNNYEGAIFSDSSKLFVNGKEMEYSVGVGNYYERYPHYSYLFEDRKMPDTLHFSLQLKDSIMRPIGYVCIRALTQFVSDYHLETDVDHDKSKPLTIDWGGEFPDSVQIIRKSYKVENGVRSSSSGPHDSFTINQHWNVSKPIRLSPDYFKDDKEEIDGLYITWFREVNGKITSSSTYGTIHAESRAQQTVSFQKK